MLCTAEINGSLLSSRPPIKNKGNIFYKEKETREMWCAKVLEDEGQGPVLMRPGHSTHLKAPV